MNRTAHLPFVTAPPATCSCKPEASAFYGALPRKCWRISGGLSMRFLMSERGVPVVFSPENPRREVALSGAPLTVYVPGNSLFHRMRNRAVSGASSLRGAIEQLRLRLPQAWRVAEATHAAEGTIVIRAPDSRVAHLAVVSRRRIEPKDIGGIVPIARPTRSRASVLLVTAPFLSPRTRELLAAAGASYIDSTGNLRLAIERPAIFLQAEGAEKDPAREPRPLVSLKGPAAGRVVRALCDFRPPYGVRELAKRCATAVASVSRVLTLLESDAIVVRGGRDEVTEVDWPALLRRWIKDSDFASSNATMTFLEPRGRQAFVDKLRHYGRPYAVSGCMAGNLKAPVEPTRLALAYVEDPRAAAEALDLKAADRGNVLLAAPFDPVVFDRTWSDRGVVYAALSQVAADMLAFPEHDPADAAVLIAWMRKNERLWRA